MTIALCLAGILVAAVSWLNLKSRETQRDGAWHSHGVRMRRRVNGAWQYREQTKDEYDRETAERSL